MEKILTAGYYWPTIFKDIFYYCKHCEVYQLFKNKSKVINNLQHTPPLGPFEKWGIDLMEPLPITKQGHRFIIVAINYLTKFAEVLALKTLVLKEVIRFVYKRIIIRFDIPFGDGIR